MMLLSFAHNIEYGYTLESPHQSASSKNPQPMFSSLIEENVQQCTPQSQACYPDVPIIKTSPCNVYPLKPQFYITKLGYARVYLFFLFLLQNIDCGYSLEPPWQGGSNVYRKSIF